MKRGLKFAVLVFALIVGLIQGVFGACPNGIISYWNFNEGSGVNANDIFGGNDGTLTNMDSLTDWVPGKIGNALDFDGINDYVNIGDKTNLESMSELTISAWIYPKSATAGTIIAKNGPYALRMLGDRRIIGQLYLDGAWGSSVYSTNSVALNSWSQATLTYNGINLNIYINNNLEGSIARTGSLSQSGASVQIGNNTLDGFNQGFNGLLDEVVIYNRALSLVEINEIYQKNNNGKDLCSCLSNDDTIMKLYSSSNSHGALWNDINGYSTDICYTDFWAAYSGATPHACTGSNKVLGLSAVTNAHAETPSLSNYLTPVCYGDLDCISESGLGDCSDTTRKVVARLSAGTNAHIETSSNNNYNTKICCKPSGGACVDECTPSGVRECHSTAESYEECGYYDADTCLEWSGYTSCVGAETCQAGVCSICTPSCTLAECGDDGCSGSCGDCDVLYPGEGKVCNAAQICEVTGNAYWADLNGEKIGAGTSQTHSEIDDTVLLIYKDMGEYLNTYDFVISEEDTFSPDDEISTIPKSETFNYNGHLAAKWIINQTEFDKGNNIFDLYENNLLFYFTVNLYQSNNLNVNNTSTTPSNSPTVVIKEPVVNSKVRVGNVIEFNQTANDADDDLKIKWTFEDGDESDWMLNCLTTGNCNTTHIYETSGTKIIEIVAREMTRTNEAVNYSQVFAYDKGINVFPVITEPLFGKIFTFSIADVQLIPFNASTSYIANCTTLACPACTYVVEDLYCYNLNKADIASKYNLFFDWTFSEGTGRSGNWNSTNYNKVVEFKRLFIAPTSHWARLRIDYLEI